MSFDTDSMYINDFFGRVQYLKDVKISPDDCPPKPDSLRQLRNTTSKSLFGERYYGFGGDFGLT